MKLGTKSLLFGAHALWLHGWFVAVAWWKLFRFPWDPRLWVAFFIHDIGYWGCADMDGIEGITHPVVAAVWMDAIFGPLWGDFCRYHSRAIAKQAGHDVSLLCLADKLAFCLMPWWLFGVLITLSGERAEWIPQDRTIKEEYIRYAAGNRRWLEQKLKELS